MTDRYNFRRSTRVQQLPPQGPGGSPNDPTPRIKLKIEDLDLDTSYAPFFVPSARPKRPKKSKPWAKWKGPGPLTDPAKLPNGWHMNEDDLEIDDVDGQIERCYERIAENIMPHVFEQRLEEYTAAKAENEQMRFPGSEQLSWDAIQRLHQLEDMRIDLESTEDEYEQLPNIEALIEAYQSGQLYWNTGLVTYWSKGVQISQPRPFDWDEFEAINSHHEGYKGFWTEGVCGPEKDSSFASATILPDPHRPRMTGLTLALRLPGIPWFAELGFIHDTGCSRMSIYQGDLKMLLGPFGTTFGPSVPVVTMSISDTCNGVIRRQVIEIEVTILDANRQRMTPWTRTLCGLNPGGWTTNTTPRLDGPILKDLLYMASVPDGTRRVFISSSRYELGLPDLDLVANPPRHRATAPYPVPPGTFATTHGGWFPVAGGAMAMPRPAAGVP